MRQALEATDGRPIAVITKRRRQTWLVTMTFDDWYALELALEAAKTYMAELRRERAASS